ncbi:type IV pilin N-terminal domain-containing protein [Halomicroarcula sp. S1AR25-4]|nr:type IV pilin N-terminal domain-containing protein [Halomicroarcula sp. S1AR25-4]
MDLKELFHDDDAVSPVIGVILMVAITVILAAVIASFVLGLGDTATKSTPQASFSFDYTQDTSGHDVLSITHDGGDTIDGARLNATVSGALDNDYAGTSSGVVFGAAASGDGDLYTAEVTAGTSDKLNADDFHDGSGTALTNNLDLSEADVKVVYTAASGDSSSTLAEWSGPDA